LAAAAGYVFMGPEEQADALSEEEALAETLGVDQAPKAPPPESRPAAEEPDETEAPDVAVPETEVGETPPAQATAPETPEAGPDEPKTSEGEPTAVEPAPAAAPEPKAAPEPESETAAAPTSPPASPPAPPGETAPPAPSPSSSSTKAETPETSQPGGEQLAAVPRPVPPDPKLPWRRNSQPFDEADTRPRIAVVLTGLGLASTMTETAIKQLPPGVTLSFTPYSRKLSQWIALARVNGHEVLLDLPMEPTTYPDDDPGPQALLTALSSRQNLDRLRWTLGRATGYVGVATTMGSRFTTSEKHMSPILKELKERGLLFLDNRASDDSVGGRLASEIGVPRAINDRPLDWAQASRVAIDARLVQLENVARTEGFAVAMGRPYPVTIERLREWVEGLNERGLVLAPISAVADHQSLRRTAQRKPQTE
jgi:polysaccharide deacetylase 2 family uncharacterized protein YibQ